MTLNFQTRPRPKRQKRQKGAPRHKDFGRFGRFCRGRKSRIRIHNKETMMANYDTNFDFGGAAESGPWLRWHARPTNDGVHQGGTWSVHEAGDGTAIDLATGLCLDWPNYRTGWIQSNGTAGIAPQKQWNRDRVRSRATAGAVPSGSRWPSDSKTALSGRSGNRVRPAPTSASRK